MKIERARLFTDLVRDHVSAGIAGGRLRLAAAYPGIVFKVQTLRTRLAHEYGSCAPRRPRASRGGAPARDARAQGPANPVSRQFRTAPGRGRSPHHAPLQCGKRLIPLPQQAFETTACD